MPSQSASSTPTLATTPPRPNHALQRTEAGGGSLFRVSCPLAPASVAELEFVRPSRDRPMRTASIIAACLLVFSTALADDAAGWKATLTKELHRCSTDDAIVYVCSSVMAMQVHFAVSAEAATILESHRREELLPYLSELQKSAGSIEKSVVGSWICVVSNNLRGTPDTATYTLRSQTKEVSVFRYQFSIGSPQPHP